MFQENGPCPINPSGGERGESVRSGIGLLVHSEPAGNVPTVVRLAGISLRELLSEPSWIHEIFLVAFRMVRSKRASDKSVLEGHRRTEVPPPWFALIAQPTSITPPAEKTVL